MNFFTKSFAAGEICPALYGRVDLAKYATGVRTMRNFLVSRSGGAYNRPGTKYCTTAQDPTRPIRLIRFTTANGGKFQLELGHLYIRPLDGGQPVMTYPINVIVATANGSNTTFVTGPAPPFVVGDQVTHTGTYTTGGTVTRTGAVTSVTGSTIVTSVNTSGFSGFTSGTLSLVTQRTVTYPAPWTSDQLRAITCAQDGNAMTFAHQAFYPQIFTYTNRQVWTFANVSMVPKTVTPSGLALSGASTGTAWYYGVTAIDGETYEESFVATIGANAMPTQSAPITVSWTNVPGAIEYNVYSGVNPGNLGFRSVVYSNTFIDNGSLIIDYADPPPLQRNFFANPNSILPQYPAAVGQFQQRRWYGNIGPVPEDPPTIIPSPVPIAAASDRIIGSRIGSSTFFALNRPMGDDDALSFRMVHRDPQVVRHFMDLGKLLVFTEQGEWVIQGGDSGISPSAVNPTCVSQNGSSYLAPLQINNVALYRQAKGSIIRTFGFEFQIEGYRGDDLTVFSNHLVDKREIVSWDYQKLPHPIVWMARDDGMMLGLTFVPEQAIVAWHRHDFTNGFVEEICQSDDRIYLVIRRVINGVTTRYIERLHTRETTPINKAVYMDSSLTFDGTTNPLNQNVTLSGGTTWDNGTLVTITSVAIPFTAGSLPGAIHVTGPDGTLVRLTNLTYVSQFVLTGTPSRLVPVSMRNVTLTNVVQAQNVLTGLAYLEGQKVSVIGDGFVVSSPNNAAYPTITVTGGQITLPQSYGVIHVGLPITADIETLNIDTAQGQTIMDKQKAITKVAIWVEQTRGLFVGSVPQEGTSLNALQGLDPTVTSFYEPKVRYSEGYSTPNNLLTRVIDQNISGAWTSHGRIIVRQVDPLPCAVLAIAPAGLAPVGM